MGVSDETSSQRYWCEVKAGWFGIEKPESTPLISDVQLFRSEDAVVRTNVVIGMHRPRYDWYEAKAG